jgi:hypothetical protein
MSTNNTVSLKQIARIAGVLYIVIIVAGMFGGLTRESLMVSGDVTATAENLISNEGTFRATIMADLIMVLADVGIGVAFYYLLLHVNKGLSLLSAGFRLAQAAALGINLLMLFLAINILNPDLGIATETAQAQAYVFFNAHAIGYNLALMFFATSIMIQGYLVYVSGYFPKILGILLMIASAGYFIDNTASFILPNYAQYAETFQMIVMIAFPVELIMALYLLIKGVRNKTSDTQQPAQPVLAQARAIAD